MILVIPTHPLAGRDHRKKSAVCCTSISLLKFCRPLNRQTPSRVSIQYCGSCSVANQPVDEPENIIILNQARVTIGAVQFATARGLVLQFPVVNVEIRGSGGRAQGGKGESAQGAFTSRFGKQGLPVLTQIMAGKRHSGHPERSATDSTFHPPGITQCQKPPGDGPPDGSS